MVDRGDQGLAKDFAAALAMYENAMDRVPDAKLRVAKFKADKIDGRTRDPGHAIKLLQELIQAKPAPSGDIVAKAQYDYAALLQRGEGTTQNFAAAREAYEEAAKSGFALAFKALAEIYGSGQGVSRDHVAAYKWWNLAVAYWPPGIENKEIIAKRNEALKSLDVNQVLQAQKDAKDFADKFGLQSKTAIVWI